MGFNRPEKTRRMLNAVRAAAPKRLFIAADGPRPDHPSDGDRCELTRREFRGVDWPCEVRTQFQDRNLGCKLGVSAAIDWFFSQVDAGIIVEDDCVPTTDFFRFCAELLDRYRHAEEVMMIGGHNPFGRWDAGASYVFSRTSPIWGWATWRRAWAHYDPTMARWVDPMSRRAVKARMPRTEFRITSQRFDLVYHQRRDTWDFAWAFAMLIAGGVSAMPARNLVENIGFDADATHTKHRLSNDANVPTYPLAFPLEHPSSTTPDADFEQALFRRRFPLSRRIVAALPERAQSLVHAALQRLG
jgi:hypothetical protein